MGPKTLDLENPCDVREPASVTITSLLATGVNIIAQQLLYCNSLFARMLPIQLLFVNENSFWLGIQTPTKFINYRLKSAVSGENALAMISGSNPRTNTLERPQNRQLIFPKINGT